MKTLSITESYYIEKGNHLYKVDILKDNVDGTNMSVKAVVNIHGTQHTVTLDPAHEDVYERIEKNINAYSK